MTFRIIYTHGYLQRASRFVRKHPDLVPQYEKTLKLLEANPFHPSLRLHRLKGRLSGLHTVSINIANRITMEIIIEEETIVPVDVGKHGNIY